MANTTCFCNDCHHTWRGRSVKSCPGCGSGDWFYEFDEDVFIDPKPETEKESEG